MLKPYTKLPLSFAEQLQLLESRGLNIPDQTLALGHLSSISYYRLSAYWYPFLQRDTNGRVTGEDVLFAGALTRRIVDSGHTSPILTDVTAIALGFFDANRGASLTQRLQATRGGRNLTELGLEADISFAAQTDTIPLIAEYFPAEKRITAA